MRCETNKNQMGYFLEIFFHSYVLCCCCCYVRQTFYRFTSFKSFRMMISRKLRITIQLFCGTLSFIFNYLPCRAWCCGLDFFRFFSGRWNTLIPFNTPVNVVVGSCVHVTQNDNPTDADVDHVLQQYIQVLQTLYEENKERFGYKEKELVIV